MDLSVFGAFGSAFFLIQSYAIGGGVRVYTPIDWALSIQLERDGFLTPLGDTNQVFGLWQSQIRFLSIPNKDFPLYFGPIMTLFTVQAEEVDIGNGLGFVGAMAGIIYQINDQLNIQTELLIRPFVFAFAEGAETQALSFFDGEGGQALAQFFGLFQINFGGNFSVHKPSKRIAPSEPPVEPDRRL